MINDITSFLHTSNNELFNNNTYKKLKDSNETKKSISNIKYLQGMMLSIHDFFQEKQYSRIVELVNENKEYFSTTSARLLLRNTLDFEGKLKSFNEEELSIRQHIVSKCFEIVDMKRRHIEYWFEEMNTRFHIAIFKENEKNMKSQQEILLNEYGNLAFECYNYHFFLQASTCFERMIQLIDHLRKSYQSEIDDSVEVVKLLYFLKGKCLRESKLSDEKIMREARASELSSLAENFKF